MTHLRATTVSQLHQVSSRSNRRTWQLPAPMQRPCAYGKRSRSIQRARHPKSASVGLLAFVHLKTGDGGSALCGETCIRERISVEAEMARPLVSPRIKDPNFFAAAGINPSGVVGLVPIARDAAQRVVRCILGTAFRQRNNVVDVVGRTGDNLRRPAIFASRLGAFRDQQPIGTTDHSRGGRTPPGRDYFSPFGPPAPGL